MNDVSEPVRGKQTIVRPRDAATLILLRGAGRELEVLAGRRPRHVKFMPAGYLCPGRALDREDHEPGPVETGGEKLSPRLARSARAASRETWEEVGLRVGRPAAASAPHPSAAALTGVEAAYAAA